MPFDTTTIDLVAETDRLTEARDDALARAEEEDRPDRERKRATREARQAEQDRRAVARLRDEYGDDAVVAVGGLTMDEKAWVTDRLGDLRQQKTGDTVAGAEQKYYAGVGLVDAPFLDEGATGYTERVAAVGEQPAPVVEWLYRKVDTISTLADPFGNDSDDG